MSEKVKITFEDGSTISIESGKKILDLLPEDNIKNSTPIIGAYANNKLVDLNYVLSKDYSIRFVKYSFGDGLRIYQSSLTFLLKMAIKEVIPQAKLVVKHSLGQGFYCELHNIGDLSTTLMHDIENKMRNLSEENIPFVRIKMSLDEAKQSFEKEQEEDKLRLLKYLNIKDTIWYKAKDNIDYYYFPLVPSSGYIKLFQLHLEEHGFMLMFPDRDYPEQVARYVSRKKLFEVFEEYEHWGELLELTDVGQLNDKISQGNIVDVIKLSEAFHDKKLAYIADRISGAKSRVRLILIAGPSSSGKTTFAKRLSFHLRVNGLHPVAISIDDYFVDRDRTPRDEKGDYDFEALEAIDIDLFNQHLLSLLKGETVELPKFDFVRGGRVPSGVSFKLNDNDILLVEGLHGLNDRLTHAISSDYKFKIYISALTQLNIDDHSRVSTSDTRIIRRMVRDSFYRAHTVQNTISRWPSVRKGEEKHIFPLQEKADAMFNSALVYEQTILKKYAVKLLETVTREEKEYSEANRLLQFLNLFLNISSEEEAMIPSNSILREFIGGSEFKY